MHSKKRKCAFSLAEALITLLIVCLITLASIPILTKKKRDITNVEHGMFACYWNGDKLVAKYSRKGAVTDGITKYDNVEQRWGCVFNPPSDAKNFVVTIVGGGGGGAAAAYKSWSKTFGAGTTNFEVPADGNYDAILIGGGGGGGGSKGGCDNPECGGGGSSAALAGFRNQRFEAGDILNFTVGSGGGSTDGDRKMGSTGGESKLTFTRNGEEKELASAGGGGGGFGFGARPAGKDPNCRAYIYTGMHDYITEGSTNQYSDTDFELVDKYPSEKPDKYHGGTDWNRVFSAAGGKAVVHAIVSEPFYSHGTRRSRKMGFTNCSRGSGGYKEYCLNKYYYGFVDEFGIDPEHKSLYGGGGNGDRDGAQGAKSGKNGIAVMKWVQSYSGLGGKAGKVLQLPFAQLPANTLAFPGKGGRGGYIRKSLWGDIESPRSGQSSYLKNYAEVLGGGTSGPVRTTSSSGDDPSNYYETKASGVTAVGGSGELANINPVTKVIGGAGGYTFIADNGYVDNSSLNGHTRPIFKNGVEISEFKNLVGAGAGGGGGAANGRDRGNGGNGSSGIVFIQW